MNCPNCGNKLKKIDNENYYCDRCRSYFTEEELNSIYSSKKSRKTESDRGVELYNKVINSVAEIRCSKCSGSGFLIDKNNGIIMTNAHCVENNRKVFSNITATLAGETIPVTVLTFGDHERKYGKNAIDLALLKLDRVPTNAVEVAFENFDKVLTGQTCYVIGNSNGDNNCIVKGIVSDKLRELDERYYLMTDCQTNPGNSGGPVFNEEGKVMGIHTCSQLNKDGKVLFGMKHAIPSYIAEKFIKEYERKK